MSWFAVKLILEAIVDDGREIAPLVEEVILVIESDSEEAAALDAARVAREKEVTYENDSGNTVEWKFERVEEVQPIASERIVTGVEVWSQMYRGPARRRHDTKP